MRTDEGATELEDAPTTPAHLFAVRAFKTAIFGTPRPVEEPDRRETVKPQHQPEPENSRPASGGQGETNKEQRSRDVGPDNKIENQRAPDNKANLPLSPSKGILLTPGTATSKRKTVSFRSSKEFERDKNRLHNGLNERGRVSSDKPFDQVKDGGEVARPTALTRTLLELSTKRPEPVVATPCPPPSIKLAFEKDPPQIQVSDGNESEADIALAVDHTIDLSQPRSQSGQHWKNEFEEYHKRSNKEMKKVIQYGQNVKSYALKKDYESNKLNEKLQAELSKVAKMETKVSRLAQQLRMARSQTPEEESDQARLVSELAQQTALTLRYQQKADKYSKALGRRSQTLDATDPEDVGGDDGIFVHQGNAQPNVGNLQSELDDLKQSAASARNRAERLQVENRRLKQSLARVKEEMVSYESRRQSREERLQKREEKHRQAREECERQLVELKAENEKLLQSFQSQTQQAEHLTPTTMAEPAGAAHLTEPQVYQQAQHIAGADPMNSKSKRRTSFSPRKTRPKGTVDVDIWTIESPKHERPAGEASPEWSGPTPIGPSSVRQDIQRTLKEIDQNLPTRNQADMQDLATRLKQPAARNVTIPSRKPNAWDSESQAQDFIDVLAPFDPKEQPRFASSPGQVQASCYAFPSRSASLLSERRPFRTDESRTNTLGSARTSSLSAERTAAAKARLAERKRSAENRGPTQMASGV